LEGRELLKGKGRSFVLILVLLAALALIGCSSSETKVNADEVVQDALAAQAEVDTSTMKITIEASAQGTVYGTDIGVSLDGSATGTMDWANKQMKGHMGLNVDLTAPLAFNAQVTGDMYTFDNVSYIRLVFMGSDNWTKTALPLDFWYTQETEQFIENILQQAADAESQSSEKVDGVSCYVLKLNPDYAALQTMLEQQADTGEEVPEIANLISSLSIKVWVAKDTSYVTKIEVVADANIPAEVLGGTAGGEGLTVHLEVTMEMTDVNEPVTIELPAEAENAEWGSPEIPFDLSMLFG
jgi:Family of unknown function (DUF6612)